MCDSKQFFRRLVLTVSTGTVALVAFGAACAADASGPTALDEIVVTASKRSENIQNVPASVSAISGDQLVQLNALKLEDYASYLPGFSIASGGTPGQTSISLRGIPSIGQGSTVGTYIDDTPVGSSTSFARAGNFQLDLMPYDLDRIEVLRGPQGTLYGASAMGGIVKYVLKTPDTEQFSGHIGADLDGISGSGTVGGGVHGAVNIPIIKDKLAVSISAFDEQTPGYIDNVGTGVKDSNKLSQYGGRVAVFWHPAENLTVKLNAMWQGIKSDDDALESLTVVPLATTNGALLVTGKPIAGDLMQTTYIPQPFRKDVDYYSAAVNWNLGFASLVSATSFSHTYSDRTTDMSIFDGTAFPFLGPYSPGIAKFDSDLGLNKFTEEVRLQSPTGKQIEWLVGAYVTHESSSNFQLEHAFTFAGVPIAGLGPYLFYASLPTTYDEDAAFGDLTVHLNDRFDVTVGGRYAHNSQNFREIAAAGPFVGPSPINIPGQSSEGTFTWMVNPRYHLTDDTMVYARVATGYQPGGPNAVIPGTPVPTTFAADTLINYETGIKSDFLEHRAIFDLSVFYIDWTNIQLNTSVGGYGYLSNGGKAVSQGFELETALYPIERLRIGLNGAFTDATLKTLTPGEIAATGNLLGYQLPNVPKWSGAVTADYNFALTNTWTARAGGGLRYVGEKFDSTPVNTRLQTFVLPSYVMLDLNAGVSNDRWNVRLFARNVTDRRAFSSGSGGPLVNSSGNSILIQAAVIQPRTIGVGVDFSF